MHENSGFVFGQHHVGCAGEFLVVQAIAVAVGVEELADDQFGFGVLAANAGHVEAPLLGRVYVGHEGGC